MGWTSQSGFLALVPHFPLPFAPTSHHPDCSILRSACLLCWAEPCEGRGRLSDALPPLGSQEALTGCGTWEMTSPSLFSPFSVSSYPSPPFISNRAPHVNEKCPSAGGIETLLELPDPHPHPHQTWGRMQVFTTLRAGRRFF